MGYQKYGSLTYVKEKEDIKGKKYCCRIAPEDGSGWIFRLSKCLTRTVDDLPRRWWLQVFASHSKIGDEEGLQRASQILENICANQIVPDYPCPKAIATEVLLHFIWGTNIIGEPIPLVEEKDEQRFVNSLLSFKANLSHTKRIRRLGSYELEDIEISVLGEAVQFNGEDNVLGKIVTGLSDTDRILELLHSGSTLLNLQLACLYGYTEMARRLRRERLDNGEKRYCNEVELMNDSILIRLAIEGKHYDTATALLDDNCVISVWKLSIPLIYDLFRTMFHDDDPLAFRFARRLLYSNKSMRCFQVNFTRTNMLWFFALQYGHKIVIDKLIKLNIDVEIVDGFCPFCHPGKGFANKWLFFQLFNYSQKQVEEKRGNLHFCRNKSHCKFAKQGIKDGTISRRRSFMNPEFGVKKFEGGTFNFNDPLKHYPQSDHENENIESDIESREEKDYQGIIPFSPYSLESQYNSSPRNSIESLGTTLERRQKQKNAFEESTGITISFDSSTKVSDDNEGTVSSPIVRSYQRKRSFATNIATVGQE